MIFIIAFSIASLLFLFLWSALIVASRADDALSMTDEAEALLAEYEAIYGREP